MKLLAIARNPLALLAASLAVMSLLAGPAGIPIGRITEIAIYTLYGIGVAVLVSYTGLVPFGAGVFFGIAAYATALSAINWFGAEPLSVLFGVAVTTFVGAALAVIVLRRRGLYFSLLTLACSQIAFEIALRWSSLTGGDNGIQNVPAPLLGSPWALHSVTCVVVVVAAWCVWRLVHTPFGRALQGIRDNEGRAASLGYAPLAYKYGAFVLSAALIALAGCLHAYLIRGAYTTYLSWEHAGDALLMLLVGGMHHFLGPLWGAIVFVLFKDAMSAVYEHWWVIFAPTIILFTLLTPNGLHGLLFRLSPSAWTLVRGGVPRRPDNIPPFDLGDGGFCYDGPVMSIRGLSKQFGSVKTAQDINLDVLPRQVHSVIGPNGAGKTTLFNLIGGQLRPDGGTIALFGQDVTAMSPHHRARCGLGRSFQIVNSFANLTAFENVRLAVQASVQGDWRMGLLRDAYAHDSMNLRTWSSLQLVGLAEHAAIQCDQLSHGERRLLEIAMTLATDAKVLLMDEPLAGLVESDRVLVSNLIRRAAQSRAVLLVEHDLDRVLALSDRISVLHQGAIIADGKPADVAANPDVIAAYIGTPGTILKVRSTGTGRRTADPSEVLRLRGLSAGYGGSCVIENIDLTVHDNEVVAVLGRNGVGKTTLLYTIMGDVERLSGEVVVDGKPITGLRPHAVNQLGIGIVPEGRRLFGNLSVADNLRIAAREGGADLDEIFDLFPKLRQIYRRRAEYLSGGERQMVAIARALMAPTKLILLDEPFEGLAPAVVQDLIEALVRLKGTRSMVLVEHDAEMIRALADRIYVLVNGRISFSGTLEEFESDETLKASLLGLAPTATVSHVR